jgi:UDP-N-acetyl-2-amino-2-deoxyglucuronate dehydrogenase
MSKQNFALIGAAGYVAGRHMGAIKETGNLLMAAFDPKDSVGILDSFFPDTSFFTEFERFDRYVDKLRRKDTYLNYMSICSPNYLHDAHIRFCLRNQANAICEKPLVLNPWNLDALEEVEKENDKKVYTILQLRLHPVIIALAEKYKNHAGDMVDVDITYITARGNWYYQSWKGDLDKSGGIASNIGIHFFDMLYWIFGAQVSSIVHINNNDCASGILQLKNARIRWFLSINADHLPEEQQNKGQRTFRSIKIDGQELEFSDGFTDLHTESYRHILNDGGFGLKDARPSIEIVYDIRNKALTPLKDDYHPFCKKVI